MKDIENMSQVEIRDSLVKNFHWDLERMAKAKGTTLQDLVQLLKYGGSKWRKKNDLPPESMKTSETPGPKPSAPAKHSATIPSDTQLRSEALAYISNWFASGKGGGAFVEDERYPDGNFPGTTIVRFVLYDRKTGAITFEMRDTSQPMDRKYLKNLPVVGAERLTTRTLRIVAAILKSRRERYQ